MPFKCETTKIPRRLDRRVKLTQMDKDIIRGMYYDSHMSISDIARWAEGKCCRRMVQFILFPEREVRAKENFKRWRANNPIKKEDRNRYANGHRKYKHGLKLKGALRFPFYCRIFYKRHDFKKSKRFVFGKMKEAVMSAYKAAQRGNYAEVGDLESHPIAGPCTQEVKRQVFGEQHRGKIYLREWRRIKKEEGKNGNM